MVKDGRRIVTFVAAKRLSPPARKGQYEVMIFLRFVLGASDLPAPAANAQNQAKDRAKLIESEERRQVLVTFLKRVGLQSL